MPSNADEDLIRNATRYAYGQLHQCGDDVARLEVPLQTVAIIDSVQGIIDNGAFPYLFGNDFPENPPYSLISDAYKRIGCASAAELIDRAVALFPFANPHLYMQERRAYMKSLPEDHEFFELGNQLCGDVGVWNALADYIRVNSKVFRLLH
jgi:Domain of unknown function (DUF4375)